MNLFLHRDRRLMVKAVSCFFLLIMTTLFAGKSIHIYNHNHSHEHCSHSSTIDGNHHHHEESESSEGNDNGDHHNCKICNFELFHFTTVDLATFITYIALITTILTLYIRKESRINILYKKNRAPPLFC